MACRSRVFTVTRSEAAFHGVLHVAVDLSGDVSPRLREELEKRGITVQDRLVPDPLK